MGPAFCSAVGGTIIMLAAIPSQSMPIPLQARPNRVVSPLVGQASVIGGQSGTDYSLLNVKDEKLAVGERLEFYYGDRNGQVLLGEPGYFHVLLDRAGKRLVIDLAQVTKTAVDPLKLEAILLKSTLVASSEMTMDPMDGSTNITLNLKTAVHAGVGVATDHQSRMFIDLRPMSNTSVGSR